MRITFNRFPALWRAALAVVVVALSLSSAPKNPYNSHQKAFYADASTVEYVNPGLNITINSAAIASNGTITTTYTLTDPNGLPLDSAGVLTPGAISLSFIAATIPNGQEQYTAYTTKVATGTVIASTAQPSSDSGGTSVNIAPGQYTYTFGTKAPTGFDATATHTIGVYGSRNLTEWNFPTDYASATYNFVPNGAKVTVTRDVIETSSCNQCHDQLSAHGGSRRGLNMCVLCHTPQNMDPNTGDTLDSKVFFHKIHMGANLPSVVAGGQYIPAINSHGTFNYSTVIFPLDGNVKDPRHCEVCHQQTTGAAQAKAFMLEPTRAACGSCHDDVNFATGANHPGGIQTTDTECADCHIPQGEMDFDASILGAHVVPVNSSLLQGLSVAINNVTGMAGKSPTISFTVLNSAGAGVPLSQLGSISVTMTGPTTDYGTTNFGSGVTTPGYVTESMSGASCSTNGSCQYTMTHQVPAGATGTFAVGIEARRTDTVPELVNGSTVQTAIEYGALNPVSYFSVDGSPVAARRTVIQLSNCNGCHQEISEHGSLRNNTEYCVFCHNPSNTDVSQRPSGPAPYNTQPDQGINFNLLVHRIHYGVNQPTNRPYIVIGFGGSVNNFSQILFPALSPSGEATDLENCSMCHVNSSEQNDLALTGLNPVTDPQGPINPIQPFSSACTGCHMDLATAAHTLSNTTALGEACNVCHGTGAAYAVDQVHAQY